MSQYAHASVSEPFSEPHTIAFDHIYPLYAQALSSPLRTAILSIPLSNLPVFVSSIHTSCGSALV